MSKVMMMLMVFALTSSLAAAEGGPSSPVAVGSAEYWGKLTDMSTFVVGDSTYAIVAGYKDDGVVIIDVSDPSSPVEMGSARHESSGFTMLDGATGVSTFVIGDSTYAIVTAYKTNGARTGVQIIDVSDPSSPVATSAKFADGRTFVAMTGPRGVSTFVIGDSTYAIVAGYIAEGVQIIDVSDPFLPVPAGWAKDDSAKSSSAFTMLGGANDVSTYVVGDSTYAIVTSEKENGVQIIDVSDPSSLVAAGSAKDGIDGFTMLSGNNQRLATFVVQGSTYAIVTATTDNGVQIIDVSDPYSPVAAGSAKDGVDGFTMLTSPQDVSTYVVGGSTYAIVTAHHGVQIIDVSDPSSPVAAGSAEDGIDGFTSLEGALAVATYVVQGSTSAIVTGLLPETRGKEQSPNTLQFIHLADPPPPPPTLPPTPGPTNNPTDIPTSGPTTAAEFFQHLSGDTFTVGSKSKAKALIGKAKKGFREFKTDFRTEIDSLKASGKKDEAAQLRKEFKDVKKLFKAAKQNLRKLKRESDKDFE